ncbi:MAG: MBL fold metallo-hydrolase, partial [Acetobacteraceae bacterium]
MAMLPQHQVPGVYHRRIGDVVVTAFSDGYSDGPVDVLHGIAPAEATRMLDAAFRPGRRISINCFAIRSAGRVALIDTGSGSYLGPTAGNLRQNLTAAGINPADVELVLLTHMHPDHSSGLTDPATSHCLFP